MGHAKLAALLALLLAPGAHAVQVDFNDIASGTLLDDEWTSASNPNINPGAGFTITTTNNSGPSWATLYDSGLTGGEDADLEGPPGTSWTGGNLSGPQTPAGNVVIIQEFVSQPEESSGRLSVPSGLHPNPGSGPAGRNAPDDDDGGGTISFQFESPLQNLGFTWIDLDLAQLSSYSIDFTDTASGETVNLEMAAFVDTFSPFYDPTVAWGDSTGNGIDMITAAALSAAFGVNLTQFDQVDFNLGAGGGIAYMRYNLINGPEPGTLPMVAAGLVWLAHRRRNQATR